MKQRAVPQYSRFQRAIGTRKALETFRWKLESFVIRFQSDAVGNPNSGTDHQNR